MTTKSNVCLVLHILLCGITIAQNESKPIEQLNEVVVSDSRFELKREYSGKTIIKITKQEIEANQGQSLASLINTKSGIEITGSRSNAGQNLGVRIRGGVSRQVVVLIDGVQVSDGSQIGNEYDLRLITLSNIESIEIIKGAASTLYGSGAATAVIQIITKKVSKKAIQSNILSSIGTNQSQENQNFDIANFNNTINLNGTLKKLSYNAAFNHQFSDGISAALVENGERDAFSKYSTDLNLGYQFTDNFTINVLGNYTDITSDFDSGSFFDAQGNVFDSEQQRIGLSTKNKYNNGSFNLNAAYSKFERDFKSNFPFTALAESYVVDAYNKYIFKDKLYTIIGLNILNNRVKLNENEEFTNIDPYINAVYISDFGLNINAGVRLNNHSEYGSHFIYNANPSYIIKHKSNQIKLLGSYSTSFSSPSLNQLFGAFGPNPNLEPEESVTLEGGAEYNIDDKLRASSIYFYREETNSILFDFTEGYFNTLTTNYASGIELELETKITKNLKASANYTYTNVDDNTVLVPKHKINTGLNYTLNKNTLMALNYQYTAKRLANDFTTFPSTLVTLDSFGLLNFNVNHTLKNNKIKLFARLDNLFNTTYQDAYGFTTLGFNTRLGLTIDLF